MSTMLLHVYHRQLAVVATAGPCYIDGSVTIYLHLASHHLIPQQLTRHSSGHNPTSGPATCRIHCNPANPSKKNTISIPATTCYLLRHAHAQVTAYARWCTHAHLHQSAIQHTTHSDHTLKEWPHWDQPPACSAQPAGGSAAAAAASLLLLLELCCHTDVLHQCCTSTCPHETVLVPP
jgi:hypothetical protein